MNQTESVPRPDKRRLVLLIASRFVPGILVIGAMLFLTAGSLSWANGWIFLGTLSCLMIVALAYLVVRDPALLERRLRLRERRVAQKRCVASSLVFVLALFLLPGLDWRFGWSKVPLALVLVGLAVSVCGYYLFFLVIRHNSYASRVIEIQEGQKVVDTGPYALMRHPMYCANCLIYLASPLLLGSWWAIIPAVAFMPFLIARILDEESMLMKELPGYDEYCRKVRWRILPGIW
jgi:protein-S-isoprenylcysteine O-methyltransferase Ste14